MATIIKKFQVLPLYINFCVDTGKPNMKKMISEIRNVLKFYNLKNFQVPHDAKSWIP